MKSEPREKLARFTEFVNSMLPHEAQYLQSVQKFKDASNAAIFQKIMSYAENIHQTRTFDKRIDKRKYSNLKSWVEEKLASIDADAFFIWLNKLDQKIMLDALTQEDELKLVKVMRRYRYPNYYFIRFYELIQSYRWFLLIRVRYSYRSITEVFLDKYHEQYQRAKQINQQLHEATIDIVEQYARLGKESKQWEEWLISVFKDESLDGLNRYYAIVRLTFLYYNYREYDKLISLYEELDRIIVRGDIYSRRILVNYYANRLMVHSRFNELETAEYYGYLSIRHKGADYLQYSNNLCSVLLRLKKYERALQLMKSSLPEFKNSLSPHNRIGFVSFYMQCLNRNGQSKRAYNFGKNFLDANHEDILNYRWHLFFISMMQSLLILDKARELLRMVRKYTLLEKEQLYRQRAGYIPTFIWYYSIARFINCEINEQELLNILRESSKCCSDDAHKLRLLFELVDEVQNYISVIGRNFLPAH